MRTLRDKVCILTGASEGIGRALALELAAAGMRLVLVARAAHRLDSLASECVTRGGLAIVVPADLTDPGSGRLIVQAGLREWSRIDVLVNNAGGTMWARFDALEDLSVVEHIMRLNYLSAVWMTAAALPALKDSRGLIVAVASVAGLTGVPERSAYAASKHAVVGFFDSLRIELAGTGVDVTIVAPDFVRSEIHKRALDARGIPLGITPMQESKIMTAAKCAALMRRAIANRKRLVITSTRGKVGRWLKLAAPWLIDRIAARAIRRRR